MGAEEVGIEGDVACVQLHVHAGFCSGHVPEHSLDFGGGEGTVIAFEEAAFG